MSNRIIKAPYINLDAESPVQINTIGLIPELPALEENNFREVLLMDLEIDSREQESITPEQIEQMVLERARQEYDRIIQAAKEEAEANFNKMVDEAQEQIMRLREEAREKGYKEGYDLGVADTEEIKEQARMLYAKAVEERDTMIREMEPDALQLIIDILDKLLTDTVNINPQIVLHLIRKGFSDSNLTGDVTIHVSEDDYQAVMDSRDEIVKYAEAGAKLDIIKDYSLKKSDCLIETPFGAIDCSLSQQYTTLRQNLYYIFENR